MLQLILVVDDKPKVARLARDYLEKNGFRVLTASDGQSALATARHEKPDLVILDLMLPTIDGREVCRILRRESEVPIIMSSCSQPCPRRSTRSLVSKSARMTISPSHSRFAPWLHVVGHCYVEHRAKSKYLESSEHIGLK